MLFRSSHLVEGNQPIQADRSQLTYGQSVTDACIDLATTFEVLDVLAAAVRDSRAGKVLLPVLP